MTPQKQEEKKAMPGKYVSKKKRKHMKKWIIAAAAAVVLLAAVFLPKILKGEQLPLLTLSDTTVLAVGNLEDSISATGTVESADSTMVYSTMAYPVMAVHVEVGDRVQAGELLAELDGAAIERQITSQQIAMEMAANSGAVQVESAQDNYENFKTGLEQGLNTTLLSAETQVQNAYDAYEKAKTMYDRYVLSLEQGENTTMLSAEAALRNACTAVNNAQDAWRTANEAYDAAWDARTEVQNRKAQAEAQSSSATMQLEDLQIQIDQIKSQLDALETGVDDAELREKLELLQSQKGELQLKKLQAEAELLMMQQSVSEVESAFSMAESQMSAAAKALTSAEDTYELQKASYRATSTTVDNTLEDYAANVETAWKTYQTALTNQAAAQKATQDQLETYSNSVAGAQAGTDNAASQESLRQLQQTLEDTKITAPCTGTVTAVYAQVGSTGSGLLFIIEDVDNLVIATSVKGYDMGTVKEGMKVRIRSDATGSDVLEGVVRSIAPTAEKNMQGVTTTTDPRFAAEVQVLTTGSALRIGMEAKLDYVVTEVSDVLTAPYDAVYANEEGQSCVIVAEPGEEDTFLLREVPVTAGAANNLDIVISGSGLSAGTRVVHDPQTYLQYVGQTVQGTEAVTNELLAMMGRGG